MREPNRIRKLSMPWKPQKFAETFAIRAAAGLDPAITFMDCVMAVSPKARTPC